MHASAAFPFASPGSCRCAGATLVSRASIKTYEIACSIHLFSILSSRKRKNGRKQKKKKRFSRDRDDLGSGKEKKRSRRAEKERQEAGKELPPAQKCHILAREQRKRCDALAVGGEKRE